MSPDNLGLRVVSAAVMAPAGLAVVYLGGPVLMLACMVCGIGMWHEYWQVSTRSKPSIVLWGLGAVVLTVSCFLMEFRPDLFLLITVVNFGALALCFLILRAGLAAWLITGIAAILAAVCGLMFVRGVPEHGLALTVTMMVCVWVTDIAAYFAGKGFGGPQLSPTNSPNKTWSGAAGAIICSGLIGVLIAGVLQTALLPWLFFAAGLSVLSQTGDLLQSYWKRHFGVKDSGRLIPGHGGLLDRLDSFSFVLICFGAILLVDPDFPYSVLRLGDA